MIGRIALPVLLAATLGACDGGSSNRPAVQLLDVPAAAGSAEPHLARGDDGTIVLSWLEPRGEGVALRHSVLRDGAWQGARTVAEGDNWFVNWADFPSVVPIAGDLWAAHWLVEQPAGGYAYDVAIALSPDGGRSWRETITPHTDATATEHGFVSLYPLRNAVGALWLDGRNLAEGGHAHGASAGVSGMTLRAATIAADSTLSDGGVVDELVCDCCQTDVAVGADGPIAAYRNRTAEEIRDIYVARLVDGAWRPGRPVADDGWRIDGCPVNGPAIAAAGRRVAVAWFTAADDLPRVRLAFSDDHGETFEPAIDVDVKDSIGRVDVELLDDGDAVVSWLRATAEDDASLSLRRIGRRGDLGAIHPIARTGAGRPAGFPQLTRDRDALHLVWTDTSAEPTALRAARVTVPSTGQGTR